MKIVIADSDNEIIENIFSLINSLELDWQVLASNSGKQCLNLLKENARPDAVLLGMMLCDMPGFDLIKHIRDDSDIPVMVLSHEKDVNIMVSAFDAGANDYIILPINDHIFVARLKALIRRSAWDTQAKKEKLANSA